MTPRKVADIHNQLQNPTSNSSTFQYRERRFRGAWLALPQVA
jgi:hypothetical protein